MKRMFIDLTQLTQFAEKHSITFAAVTGVYGIAKAEFFSGFVGGITLLLGLANVFFNMKKSYYEAKKEEFECSQIEKDKDEK
jgi:ABC-type antimicrobial peptide transport system permease subunit